MPLGTKTLKGKNPRTEKQKAEGRPANPKVRSVIDHVELDDLIGGCFASGAEMVIIEELGKRPGEMGGATSGFGAGLIFAFCYKANYRIEMVAAATWKKAMQVPADKKEAVARAELLFPLDRRMFRTSTKHRDTLHDGRAEAAMLAMFAAQHRS